MRTVRGWGLLQCELRYGRAGGSLSSVCGSAQQSRRTLVRTRVLNGLRAATLSSLLLIGCKPVCSASGHVDMIMAGQRDVVRCPDQTFRDTPAQIEAVQRCLREAVAARRPFVAPIRVGVPGRGEGLQFLVGRVQSGELEIFDLAEVNPGQAGARVVGLRCDGFSGLGCASFGDGTTCRANCAAYVSEAPSPPFPAAPNNPGEVWCGPAF